MEKKLCTIVGFGPGIGSAVARVFAREGYALALLSRNPEKHDAYAQELAKEGAVVSSIAADAGDASNLQAALDKAHAQLGLAEVLIYNAFAFRSGKPSRLTAEQLTEDFRTTVAGALTAANHVAPAMKEAKRGTLLFTGGGLALEPVANFASVSLGKAALRNLVFSLAQELTPAGVHVATVTICGMVRAGTHFDPAAIAESFFALHQQEPGAWEIESLYR